MRAYAKNGQIHPDSVQGRLLTTLKELVANGDPFTVEDLTVWAWRRHPQVFGLKGYARDYPSSQTVKVACYGARGLIRKGYIVRRTDGLYQLPLRR
jgi:hypothetical protein